MVQHILAIAGPSGAGKSTLADSLLQKLREARPDLPAAVLPEDAYYHDQTQLSMAQRRQVNYDHPAALEHELLLEHLGRLRAGHAIPLPLYDYTQHTRSPKTRTLPAPALLIVEGILLLSNETLRRHFDYSIFLDTSLSVCLERRLHRDREQRARSPDFIRAQFDTTVRPMYREFVVPSIRHADRVVPESETQAETVRQLLDHIDAQKLLGPTAAGENTSR